MKTKTKSKIKHPICVGSGLLALDVVINGNPKVPLKLFAGGSCGNVLTILSFMKWESYPIARLNRNNATKKMLSDLKEWNVKTNLITQTEDGSTPIIIQRIKKDKNGNSTHTFQFKNPDNGEWLPSYKPVLGSDVESLTKKSPCPNVYYFDRVSRSTIDLAKYYKSQGALIYFEPSSMAENKQFEECLNVADVFKYSSDRIKNYANKYPSQRVPLEIETLGKDGVRFRYSQDLSSKKWVTIPGYQISYVVDAAGSGDWFSAGLISIIGKTGLKSFKKSNEKDIIAAIKYGQALGALNCFFDGARGIMYSIDLTKVKGLVKKIQNNKTPMTFVNNKEVFKPIKQFTISSLY